MKNCSLIAATIVAASVSGVASASTVVVFDDFSVDQTTPGTVGAAVWGDPLGSGLERGIDGGNISGGLWAPGFFEQIYYGTTGSSYTGYRTGYTGIYLDFVGGGSLLVSVGGSAAQQVTGMANERVFLDFASLSGMDPDSPYIALVNFDYGTSLGGFGFYQPAVVPLPGVAGMALAGMGMIGLRRRR